MQTTYIGIGSNLNHPVAQVQEAIRRLHEVPRSTLVQCSHLYQSAAWGITEQPDFINAVARLDTELAPESLLEQLLHIEQSMGRHRVVKWGPRIIDLDILLYGGLKMNTAHLEIPHARMLERNFVLIPLAEIAPDLILPNGQSVKTLAESCPDTTINKLKN